MSTQIRDLNGNRRGLGLGSLSVQNQHLNRIRRSLAGFELNESQVAVVYSARTNFDAVTRLLVYSARTNSSRRPSPDFGLPPTTMVTLSPRTLLSIPSPVSDSGLTHTSDGVGGGGGGGGGGGASDPSLFVTWVFTRNPDHCRTVEGVVSGCSVVKGEHVSARDLTPHIPHPSLHTPHAPSSGDVCSASALSLVSSSSSSSSSL